MIKNERNFAIVRGRVERLERVQDALLEKLAATPDDRAGIELQMAAVRAEIRRMRDELDDYEALKAGKAQVGVAERIEDLPRLLIRARIAAGLTHGDLAERLGLHPQQIQRYEATDYESASLSRLVEVARALDLDLSHDLQGTSPTTTAPRILRTLRDQLGYDRSFLERRFGLSGDDENTAAAALGLASHMLGLRPDDILEGDAPSLAAAAPVAYKRPNRASDVRALGLSGYARYLTHVVLQALPRTQVALPANPFDLHARITDGGGTVTFATALHAVWEAGVPVLPLNEGGGFHGGWWRHGGRDIIVINSGHDAESLWLFYLLHEVGHIGDSAQEHELLETSPGNDALVEPERERRANEFATAVIFGGHGDELAGLALGRSQGKLGLLQRAVRWAARTHKVDAGALAFNVAHRLSQEGTDWWGAAMALQESGGDPWAQASQLLIDRLDWSALGPLDADLLGRALDHLPDASISGGGGS